MSISTDPSPSIPDSPSWDQKIGPWRLSQWLLLFLALGILVRLTRYLLQFPIWGDESFIALNLLDRDYSELVGKLRFAQVSPLLFLWGQKTTMLLIGSSELALRLLPFLAGLGALILFARLAKRELTPAGATLAVALLAVAYFPVRHSSEVKPYAFDLLFSIALLIPAAQWLKRPDKTAPLWCLALIIPIAILSSYPSVFVGGAVSLALFPTLWKQRALAPWLAFGAFNLLMLAAFGFLYFQAGEAQYQQMGGTNNVDWDSWFAPHEPLALIQWLFSVHTGDLLAYPVGGPSPRSLVPFVLFIVGGVTLWRSGQKKILLLLLSPFALTFVASWLKRYPYGGHARIAQHLAPSICLLVAVGICACLTRLLQSSEKRSRVACAVLVGLALLGFGEMGRDFIRPHKSKGDNRCRMVCEEVVMRAGPEDVIVVLNAPPQMYPVLEWYLRQHPKPIQWVKNVDELKSHSLPVQFWCVQFETNATKALPLPNKLTIRDRPYLVVEQFQRPLLLGWVPIAIQQAHIHQWRQQDHGASAKYQPTKK